MKGNKVKGGHVDAQTQVRPWTRPTPGQTRANVPGAGHDGLTVAPNLPDSQDRGLPPAPCSPQPPAPAGFRQAAALTDAKSRQLFQSSRQTEILQVAGGLLPSQEGRNPPEIPAPPRAATP